MEFLIGLLILGSIALMATLGATPSTTTFPTGGGGALNQQVSGAGVGNGADATDDDLFTYTIPAGTLAADGDMIRLTFMGAYSATGNTKTFKAWFGGLTMASNGNTNASQAVIITALITRVDVTHINSICQITRATTPLATTNLVNQAVPDMDANWNRD